MSNKTFTIAVDFDGTCVKDDFPRVGKDVFGAEIALKKLVSDGHKIILWTCREHSSFGGIEDTLQLAIDWFNRKGIPLYGKNGNPDMFAFPTCRKCHADFVIDDHAVGVPRCENGDLDWFQIYRIIKRACLSEKSVS